MEDSSSILYIIISILLVVIPSIFSAMKQKKIRQQEVIQEIPSVEIEKDEVPKKTRKRIEAIDLFLDVENSIHSEINEDKTSINKRNKTINLKNKVNLSKSNIKQAIIYSEIINKKYN